jgi:hypothetical protein
MTQQRLTIDRERKNDLRRKMLAFFGQEGGKRSINLEQLPEFEGYDKQEIRLMLYGLDSAGLLKNINGRTTSGAMYGLTELGRVVLVLDVPTTKRDGP